MAEDLENVVDNAEVEMLLDFSVVCRVCRRSGHGRGFLSLFRVGLSRKLMACAGVQVWQNDGLPGQICRRCAARLHEAHRFKQQCERSDLELRRARDAEPIAPIVEPPPGEFRCPVCDKAFVAADRLARHSRIHSDEPPPYRCDICNRTFVHGGNYKAHVRGVHGDERPFACAACGRRCKRRQDLEKHARTHTGDRPHVCLECGYAFATTSGLAAHARTHTDERPYVCAVCARGFTQAGALAKHARRHTGERTHFCAVCARGFNGSQTLAVHMRTHTGEKPYHCTVCDKRFTQSSSLSRHSRNHAAPFNVDEELDADPNAEVDCLLLFNDDILLNEEQ